MKTPLILALATAAALPLASAQDAPRPDNPQRPPDAERPPGARPEGTRERRPEGARPPGDAPERRKPDAPRPDGERREGPRPEGERREGPRQPGDRRDGARAEAQTQEGGARADAWAQAGGNFAPRPQKPTAYLGVVTAPVPPPLAAQLGLPEGFGLVVEEIMPDSPAAQAGVQRFDILKQMNDQQLIDPNQLSSLVRNAGKDADVTLTVVRKGAEQKLNVKVGERMLPERRPMAEVEGMMRNLAPMRERAERGAQEMQERMQEWKGEFGERMKDYQERMKDYTNRMREYQERAGKDRQGPGGTPPQPPKAPEPPKPPQFDAPREPAPADMLKEVRPGGAPGVRLEQDGNVTVWNTANARAIMKDDEGEVELRSENGKRIVTARDRDGKETFSGPIDSEEQRAAVPGNVRRKLDRMDIKTNVHGGGASPGGAAVGGGSGGSGDRGPARGSAREVQ